MSTSNKPSGHAPAVADRIEDRKRLAREAVRVLEERYQLAAGKSMTAPEGGPRPGELYFDRVSHNTVEVVTLAVSEANAEWKVVVKSGRGHMLSYDLTAWVRRVSDGGESSPRFTFTGLASAAAVPSAIAARSNPGKMKADKARSQGSAAQVTAPKSARRAAKGRAKRRAARVARGAAV